MSDPTEEQSTEGGEALGSTADNVNKGKRKEYKDREDNTQTHLELNTSKVVETEESKVCLQVGKFNREKARRSIAEMLIIDELPFKEFCILDNIQCEKSLVVDVPTRWNSTYLMLSVAIKYEQVFGRFIEEDFVYTCDLREGDGADMPYLLCWIRRIESEIRPPGVPEIKDWANARLLVVFLKHFYDMTLRVSGTKYINLNSYLECINCLDTVLKQCFLTDNNDLKSLSIEIMKKFDKYWGDTKKFNMLVFIAFVFGSRTKFKYLKVNLCSMYGIEEGNDDGNEVVTLCRNALKELFNDYNVESLDTVIGVFEDKIETMRKKNMAEVKRRKAESDTAKELSLSWIGWWKKRSMAFLILSLVARDILSILVSTVASESTFSTGEIRNISIESSAGALSLSLSLFLSLSFNLSSLRVLLVVLLVGVFRLTSTQKIVGLFGVSTSDCRFSWGFHANMVFRLKSVLMIVSLV
uniref:Zinc finger BED domain-containing protein RICESLEEPER 2-like n=1 Tax=Tanacetum cinerariifolium TaxID=118510 RepID=A0A6L2J255_TANCI|nr:hypothetical protein [Tanacetum cinerariifolium]